MAPWRMSPRLALPPAFPRDTPAKSPPSPSTSTHTPTTTHTLTTAPAHDGRVGVAVARGALAACAAATRALPAAGPVVHVPLQVAVVALFGVARAGGHHDQPQLVVWRLRVRGRGGGSRERCRRGGVGSPHTKTRILQRSPVLQKRGRWSASFSSTASPVSRLLRRLASGSGARSSSSRSMNSSMLR